MVLVGSILATLCMENEKLFKAFTFFLSFDCYFHTKFIYVKIQIRTSPTDL